MTTEEHKEAHEKLHLALDALMADWIDQTGNLPSQHTIMELAEWSYEQTKNPTHHD